MLILTLSRQIHAASNFRARCPGVRLWRFGRRHPPGVQPSEDNGSLRPSAINVLVGVHDGNAQADETTLNGRNAALPGTGFHFQTMGVN